MRVATLAIGDELLDGRSHDRHGAWLSAQLERLGCEHIEHRVLPDTLEVIAQAFLDLSSQADVVLCTGGLGPTPDDVTREGLARAMGEELVEDVHAIEALRARYAASGRTPSQGNMRQVLRPSSGTCIPNAEGTAPGIDCALNGARVMLLPGPPREMHAMFAGAVADELAVRGQMKPCASVQAFGLSESEAAERLGSRADRNQEPLVGFKVTDSIVRADVRGDRADDVAAEIHAAWSPFAFAGAEGNLADALGAMLLERQATVVTAESCTGGLLGGAFTSVAGSSGFYRGGMTTYSNEMKTALLGVPEPVLRDSGAVSKQVALVMAMESARRLGSGYSLSTTGIAGPGGGSDEKPVGSVWIGLCDATGSHPIALARLFQFPGDRDLVRDRTVKSALQMLRLHLLGEEVSLLWERSV